MNELEAAPPGSSERRSPGVARRVSLVVGGATIVATSIADRIGWREAHVRLSMEIGLLVVAVALRGPLGIGTLIFAALIGHAVARGVDWYDRARPAHAHAASRGSSVGIARHEPRCSASGHRLLTCAQR